MTGADSSSGPCPVCAKGIDAAAVKCPHCLSFLARGSRPPWVPPRPREDNPRTSFFEPSTAVWMGGSIVLGAAAVGIKFMAPRGGSLSDQLVRGLVVYAAGAVGLVAIICLVLWARGKKTGPLAGVLTILGLIVAVLGGAFLLLVLLLTSTRR